MTSVELKRGRPRPQQRTATPGAQLKIKRLAGFTLLRPDGRAPLLPAAIRWRHFSDFLAGCFVLFARSPRLNLNQSHRLSITFQKAHA